MRLSILLAIVCAAALLAGCKTPDQEREEDLRRQMICAKEQTDRKEAARTGWVRGKLDVYEAKTKGASAPAPPQPAQTSSPPPMPLQAALEPPDDQVLDDFPEDEKPAPARVEAAPKPRPERKGWEKDLIRDLRAYPGNMITDTLGFFDRDNLLENFLVLSAGISVAMVSKNTDWDDAVQRAFNNHHRFGAATNVADVLGNPGTQFGFAAIAYTYGEAAKNYRAAETGRQLFEALAINDLITLGLQLATNQRRPNGQDFSFPSGHTSSSFALAAVLDGVYGPLVGVPMYGLAGFIGVARLDANKHYLSDVIMGAALGYMVGRTVTKTHRKMSVLGFEANPWVEEESGAGGVQLRKRF